MDISKHADIMCEFSDRIVSVVAWADNHDILDGECAQELRRIADELDAEAKRAMKHNRERNMER